MLGKPWLLLAMLIAWMSASAVRAQVSCSPVSVPAAALTLSSAAFPRDAPIGSASAPILTTFVTQCDADPGYQRDAYFTYTLTPASLVAGYSNVYQTNLAGIGVRYTLASGVMTGPQVGPPGCDKSAPLPYVLTSNLSLACHNLEGTGTFTYTMTIRAELIKVANSTVGSLTSVPALSVIMTMNNQAGTFPIGNVLNGSASATFANLACTTRNAVPVDLKQHKLSELTGPGTFTSSTGFSIALDSCPAGMNSITYEFHPTTSIVAGTGGSVVTLDATSTATGIGLQLLDGSGSVVGLGAPVVYSQYDPSSGGSYTIPFQARYYQTGATAGAGTANTAMTFTMSYL